jgi:formylglycine-generating enzyme required for sulfatase activity
MGCDVWAQDSSVNKVSLPTAPSSTQRCWAALQDFSFLTPKQAKAIEELAALQIELDLKQSQGGESAVDIALTHLISIKQKQLLRSIRSTTRLSAAALQNLIRAKIQRQQEARIRDNQTEEQRKQSSEDRKDTNQVIPSIVVDGRSAIFERIAPGRLATPTPQDPSAFVAIPNSFDLMATPTTQLIWAGVIKLAKDKLKSTTSLNPHPSMFQGELLPVEQVSYNDVIDWFDLLNELSRQPLHEVPELQKLIPSHQTADVYRLPTEAEWEFVASLRSTSADPFFFGKNPDQSIKYAWVSENSNDRTQPVAQLQPVLIGSAEIYDLLGNVAEWVSNKLPLQDSESPSSRFNPDPDTLEVLKGGSFLSEPRHIQLGSRQFARRDHRAGYTGFRMARSVKPQSDSSVGPDIR